MFQQPYEALFEKSVTVSMPTEYGLFRMTVFTELANSREHILLEMGEPERENAPLVRVHSECATGDLFGSKRCDCGEQLNYALKRIAEEGSGVLIYLRQEGRGIGLANKMMAYQLQDQGMDTVEANLSLGFEADQRSYDLAASILESIGLKQLRLLTNNPEKVRSLTELGLIIKQRLAIEVGRVAENQTYLATKKSRMGHLLGLALP